jgi:uncharacterized protein YjbI with pentapeptide repeats
VHLIGVHLIGVHFTDVRLVGVHLAGVHLIDVHLAGVRFAGVYIATGLSYVHIKSGGKGNSCGFHTRFTMGKASDSPGK